VTTRDAIKVYRRYIGKVLQILDPSTQNHHPLSTLTLVKEPQYSLIIDWVDFIAGLDMGK